MARNSVRQKPTLEWPKCGEIRLNESSRSKLRGIEPKEIKLML